MNPLGADAKYSRKHNAVTTELIGGAFNTDTRRLNIGGKWLEFPLSIAVVPAHRDGWANSIAIDVDQGGPASITNVLQLGQQHGLWGFAQMGESTTHSGGHVRFPCAPIPLSLASHLAKRIMGASGAQGEEYPRPPEDNKTPDLRLPLMLHLRAPNGYVRFPLLLPTGESIDTIDPWKALTLLHESWSVNSDEAITAALSTLPQITAQTPVRQYKSKVNTESAASVITWFNDNHDLVTLLKNAGAKERGKILTCPFHDDRNPSFGIWVHHDGRLVGRCFSQHSNCPAADAPYVDSFDVHCLIERAQPRDAVRQVAEQYGLGQRRTMKMERQPKPINTPQKSHKELIADARLELATTITHAAEQHGKVTIIRATPGMGKTHTAAQIANNLHASGKNIAIVAPTLAMANDEWLPRLNQAFVWRSRLDICTCEDKEYLRQLSNLGYVLPKCSDDCPYKHQYTQRNGHIAIYQHNHLHLNDGKLLDNADIVIIDESPLSALLEEQTVTLEDIRVLKNRLTSSNDPAVPLLHALWCAAKDHGKREESLHGTQLLLALADTNNESIIGMIESAEQSMIAIKHPLPPDNRELLRKQFLADLLIALKHDTQHTNSLLAWARTGNGVWGYTWHKRNALLEECHSKTTTSAVIILDGSADECICRQLYAPWTIELVSIDVPLSPAVRVIQCTTTASTRKIVQHSNLLERTTRSIGGLCAKLDIMLDGGVSYQGANEYIAQSLGGIWLHYGGQRGRNDLASAKALAIIASPTTPPDVLHRKAMALWSDDSQINATWKRHGVGDWRAEDKRLEAVARLYGPEELRQAAHRCRPILSSEPTTLLVFSPWQLDSLGLHPSEVIVELPHGNSKEAKMLYDSYQEQRQLRQEKADRGGIALALPDVQENRLFEKGYVEDAENTCLKDDFETAKKLHTNVEPVNCPPYRPLETRLVLEQNDGQDTRLLMGSDAPAEHGTPPSEALRQHARPQQPSQAALQYIDDMYIRQPNKREVHARHLYNRIWWECSLTDEWDADDVMLAARVRAVKQEHRQATEKVAA